MRKGAGVEFWGRAKERGKCLAQQAMLTALALCQGDGEVSPAWLLVLGGRRRGGGHGSAANNRLAHWRACHRLVIGTCTAWFSRSTRPTNPLIAATEIVHATQDVLFVILIRGTNSNTDTLSQQEAKLSRSKYTRGIHPPLAHLHSTCRVQRRCKSVLFDRSTYLKLDHHLTPCLSRRHTGNRIPVSPDAEPQLSPETSKVSIRGPSIRQPPKPLGLGLSHYSASRFLFHCSLREKNNNAFPVGGQVPVPGSCRFPDSCRTQHRPGFPWRRVLPRDSAQG